MILKDFLHDLAFFLVSSLRGGLNSFYGTWLRCNSLEWNGHFASLRLALHPKNRTLHPVQLPDLGLISDCLPSYLSLRQKVVPIWIMLCMCLTPCAGLRYFRLD